MWLSSKMFSSLLIFFLLLRPIHKMNDLSLFLIHILWLTDGVGQQQIPLCCCITYSKWVDEWRWSCMNVCLSVFLCMGVCVCDNFESVWPWSFNNYLRMFWWRCCCCGYCCRCWCRCCVNGCVLPFRLLMFLLCVVCFVCVPACLLDRLACGEVVDSVRVCVSVYVHVCKYST